MTRRERRTLAFHLAADILAAGFLVFLFCLQSFLLVRGEASAAHIRTWDATGPETPWSDAFPGAFAQEPTFSNDSYAGPSASVTISTISRNLDNSHALTCYIADIRVSDVRCIRTALAHDTFGVGIQEPILDMMTRSDAIVAMNGDYYSYQGGGLVIRNGEVFGNTPADVDICVLFRDGYLRVLPPDTPLKGLVDQGAWQAWTFGPALLNGEGRPASDLGGKGYLRKKHPRSAIGFFEPGHYCFVVVDGRRPGYSNGATFKTLAGIMIDLGCKAAYNLDGGNSSVLAFGGAIRNRPSGDGREISDCVLVKEFAP